MLYKRYGDPTALLQQAIEANRLGDYIIELISIVNEEKEESAKWEFYLHHAFLSKTYNDFYDTEPETPTMPEIYDDNYVETTKQKARDILKKFRMI